MSLRFIWLSNCMMRCSICQIVGNMNVWYWSHTKRNEQCEISTEFLTLMEISLIEIMKPFRRTSMEIYSCPWRMTLRREYKIFWSSHSRSVFHFSISDLFELIHFSISNLAISVFLPVTAYFSSSVIISRNGVSSLEKYWISWDSFQLDASKC